MLVLGRLIDDHRPQWINIHINYADNPQLVSVIESLGGNARMLDNIIDIVKVQPVDCIRHEFLDEVVTGFEAPKHIVIRRSELDRKSC